MIIYDEPNDVYHANPAISSSQAKLFRESPQLLRDSLDGVHQRSGSSAMSFGSYVHHRVLTPDEPSDYAVKPYCIDGRTKAGKAWMAEHEGCTFVTEGEANAAQMMLNRMPDAVSEMLDACPVREASIRLDGNGVAFQCRPDAWNGGDMVVDLKTTSKFGSFTRDIVNYAYDLSAGWYCDLIQRETGVKPRWKWIVAESVPPFRWAVYDFGGNSLLEWQDEAQRIQAGIEHCVATGDWSDDRPLSHYYETPEWRMPV